MEITSEAERSGEPSSPKNRLAIIGFAFMLAGPALIIFAGLLQNWTGDFHKISALIIAWTSVVLPGIGAVISIVSLILRKSGKLGKALSIVTLIMCNPFFYYYYFFICMVMGITLAGLPLM
jgi:hypothetical protein